MTNSETTNLSLAQHLMKSGSEKTSLMRTITELVGSYLGNTAIEGNLLNQLQTTNTAIKELVDQPKGEVKPSKLSIQDSSTEIKAEELKKAA